VWGQHYQQEEECLECDPGHVATTTASSRATQQCGGAALPCEEELCPQTQLCPTRNEKDAEESNTVGRKGLVHLLAANKHEWPYTMLGMIAAIALGGAMPLYAILFGGVTNIFRYKDLEQARSESVEWAFMFGLLGLGCTLAMTLQGLMFGIAGGVKHSHCIAAAFKHL
jgi:hypothetical protein